jgi:hypothetical protein
MLISSRDVHVRGVFYRINIYLDPVTGKALRVVIPWKRIRLP